MIFNPGVFSGYNSYTVQAQAHGPYVIYQSLTHKYANYAPNAQHKSVKETDAAEYQRFLYQKWVGRVRSYPGISGNIAMACSKLLFMRKSATCFTHVEKSSLLDHLYIMKSFICSALFTSLVISSAVAGFEEGIAAYQANNLPLAYKEFRAAAENGHIDSQFNLGMLYVRGQSVKENTVAGVALLLLSATMDSSPGNNAKQNIAGIRGLTPGMIDAAKTLFTEMGNAENLLVPFDQYLKKTEIE
jgi:hypothetical protein